MTDTQVIGRYDIVSELGRGGMGVVFKAWEESLQRFVAIKMLGDQLTQDQTVVERFLREARAVADLNHPNVVQVFAVDTHEGRPYFAMEYVEGSSLTELIHTSNQIEPKRAAQIIKEAANGLAAAHANHVIHRDIKPDNVMLTKHGGVKVVDFGIAKVDDPDSKLTATGMMVGTPNYISPEVCLGQEVDAGSDIFSLGIVFFEMLSGSTPFNADSPIAMMTAVVQAEIPDITTLNPQVDEKLRAILARMLQKERKNRYLDCTQIMADLDAYLMGQPLPFADPFADAVTIAVARPESLGAVEANKPPPVAAAAKAAPNPSKKAFQLGWVVALLLFVGAAAGSWYYVGEGSAGGIESSIATNTPESLQTISPVADPVVSLPTTSDTPTNQEQQQIEDLGNEISNNPTETIPDPIIQEEIAIAQPPSRIDVQPEIVAPQPTPTPVVTKGPSKFVVIARGDPSIASTVESVLEGALLDAELDVLDEQFFSGFDDRAANFDLAGVSRLVQDNGGDVLILASLRETGQRQLNFYGRSEQQTLATLQIQAVSLAQKRNLGAPWRVNLEYVPLNASDSAAEAALPIAEELVQRLQALD